MVRNLKMTLRWSAAAIVLGAAAVGLTAMADPPTQPQVETRQEMRLILADRDGPDGEGGPDLAWQGRDHPPGVLFEALDSDKDGVVTRSEFDTWRADKRRDVIMFRGGEGGPPPGPGRERREIRLLRNPENIDVNGDGKITFDEFAAPMKQHFDSIDADKDGSLSPQEMKAPPRMSSGR